MRVILFICFLFSAMAQAAAPFSGDRQLEIRVQNLQSQLSIFEQICMQNGQVIDRVVTDGNTNINCPHENDHLRVEILALKKFIAKEEAIAGCGPNGSISSLAEQLAAHHNAIQKHGLSCNAQEAHQSAAACLGDVTCNLARALTYGVSPMGPLLRGLKGLEEKVHTSAKKDSCMSTAKSDCFTELVAGVMTNLWSNVQVAWQLAYGAASWAAKKVVSGWNYMWGIEDRSTEKMMAASKQSKSFVDLFLKDPWAAIKQMGQSIYQMIADGIRENFMCNRWSGQPHLSTCLEKNTQGWDCASCGQKLDAVCGVVGFAGGEIVTAYLTGGVLSIGKSAGKIGLKLAGKIGSRVAEALPDFAKAAITASARTAVVIGEVGSSQLAQRIEAVLNSPASKAVIKFSEKSKKLGQTAWELAASQSAITVPLSITLKGGKVLTYPIRKYLALMDSALHLGLSHGDAAIVAAHNGLLAAGIVRATERSAVASQRASAAIALDDASRAAAQESLRAKHITESNATSFFDKGNPIPLQDSERVYLTEHVLGIHLNEQEAKRVLELHNIGDGYGQYTIAQLKEKAVGIRDLLAARGISDPERVNTAIDTLLRQGILGKVPEAERVGFMASLKGLFKGKGDAAPASSLQEGSVVKVSPGLEDARAQYISTKKEVLDPGLASPEVRAAASIRADDLFAAQFRGTMHEMITTEAFRDHGIYAKGGGRELWWGETVLEGKDSLSPLSAVYGKNAAGEVIPTRRTIYWPKDQIEAGRSATGRAEYPLNLQSYRVVTNEAFENGKWTQKSIEAIGRNAKGEYVPMFYVRDGEKWVASRTFQGMPVEKACIKCHNHPSNPSVFTAFPYSARPGLDIHQLSPLYQNDALKMIERDHLPALIGDRQGRPGTAPLKVKAREQVSLEELHSPETAERARKTAARIGLDRDRRAAETERVLGRLFEGRPGLFQKQALHRAAELDEYKKRGPWTQADIELRESILSYGKTPDELAALKAEGKPMPNRVFQDEADVQRIIYEGLIGISPSAP